AWIEPPHHVAVLQREPEVARLIENRRGRILGFWIGHPILLDRPRLRIESADVRIELRREPDVALFVRGDSKRSHTVGQSCIAGRQVKFLERARPGIETSNETAGFPR